MVRARVRALPNGSGWNSQRGRGGYLFDTINVLFFITIFNKTHIYIYIMTHHLAPLTTKSLTSGPRACGKKTWSYGHMVMGI